MLHHRHTIKFKVATRTALSIILSKIWTFELGRELQSWMGTQITEINTSQTISSFYLFKFLSSSSIFFLVSLSIATEFFFRLGNLEMIKIQHGLRDVNPNREGWHVLILDNMGFIPKDTRMGPWILHNRGWGLGLQTSSSSRQSCEWDSDLALHVVEFCSCNLRLLDLLTFHSRVEPSVDRTTEMRECLLRSNSWTSCYERRMTKSEIVQVWMIICYYLMQMLTWSRSESRGRCIPF